MLSPIRRIVTGHDASGRSVMVSDATAALRFEPEDWPNRGTTILWVSPQTPADNIDETFLRQANATILPSSGGTTFTILQLAPESDLDAMSPELRAKVTQPVARLLPHAIERDTSRHYGMHATDTLDYLVVLQGEVTLMLDEGEVTLKPFDTVIQRGSNHAWVNRGAGPCLVAAMTVDARPVDRDANPPRSLDDHPVDHARPPC